MSELTISVTQLNNYIKNIFDAEEMLIGIKVVGEITNLKPSSKAVYFDLKDENASLSCVVFDERIVEGIKFGDKVTVKGKLNYYVKGGKLSFVVSKIEKFGVGDLYQEYIQLKEKLSKEGLFLPEHKKPIPEFVRRVGVVTSRTGAVIRDIIRVKHSKNHYSDVVLFPVKVQGIGAKEEIIKGIEFLDDYGVDVIIVARGGGSFEDYQPFNTEEVVRAAFKAKTPIVSAIGHENDWSLLDFVADERASTPSVASEMVFFDEKKYLERLLLPLKNFINNLSSSAIDKYNKVNNLFEIIVSATTNRLLNFKTTTDIKINNLIGLVERNIERNTSKIDILMANISKNNPLEILSRGYARVTNDGINVKSVSDVKVGEEIEIAVKDGLITSKVIQVKEKILWKWKNLYRD